MRKYRKSSNFTLYEFKKVLYNKTDQKQEVIHVKCMKCGKSIRVGQVFCEECLTDMERHPVKPGTPVLLPRREKQAPVKRSRKRIRKPEEIIHRLRRTVLVLMALVAALAIALSICIHLLMTRSEITKPNELPGQNYGTSESID